MYSIMYSIIYSIMYSIMCSRLATVHLLWGDIEYTQLSLVLTEEHSTTLVCLRVLVKVRSRWWIILVYKWVA